MAEPDTHKVVHSSGGNPAIAMVRSAGPRGRLPALLKQALANERQDRPGMPLGEAIIDRV